MKILNSHYSTTLQGELVTIVDSEYQEVWCESCFGGALFIRDSQTNLTNVNFMSLKALEGGALYLSTLKEGSLLSGISIENSQARN